MSDSIAPVFWDPSPEQIGCQGCKEINPASLRSAGYEFIGKDKDSLDTGKVDLWKHQEDNRWVLILKYGVGNKVVASALVFTSQQISNVVDRFSVVLGVMN